MYYRLFDRAKETKKEAEASDRMMTDLRGRFTFFTEHPEEQRIYADAE